MSRAPLLEDSQVYRLQEHGLALYQLLMSQPPEVDTFEVDYGVEDLGIGGTTVLTTTAITDMLKNDWLEVTMLQMFSM